MALMAAAVEIASMAIVAGTYASYYLKAKSWQSLQLERPNSKPKNEVCILLPVWNEGLVIEKKLADLAAQIGGSYHLVVIDSASDDNTVQLVNSYLEHNSQSFASFHLIEMEKRLGKTAAVAQAIDYLRENHPDSLTLMTDADAILAPGAIEKMRHWFSDASIGAVGALARREGGVGSEKSHRQLSDWLRISEAKRDSTPFLEGSCMMWRTELIQSGDLNTKANADDAQIALACRLAGRRVVVDEELWFLDYAPTTAKGQRRQKKRRAQGLQRMLTSTMNKRLDGWYAKIVKSQRQLHLWNPLILAGTGIAAITRMTVLALSGMPSDATIYLHYGLTVVEGMVLLAWLNSRFSLKLPLAPLDSVVESNEILLQSLITSARGRSLHMWQQHSDTRLLLAEDQ